MDTDVCGNAAGIKPIIIKDGCGDADVFEL